MVAGERVAWPIFGKVPTDRPSGIRLDGPALKVRTRRGRQWEEKSNA